MPLYYRLHSIQNYMDLLECIEIPGRIECLVHFSGPWYVSYDDNAVFNIVRLTANENKKPK